MSEPRAPIPAPRLTIPTRIFGSIVALVIAFLVAQVASTVAHQRSASALRLLHEGYLPLALTVGQAKADQSVFGTMIDRILDGSDTAPTRRWLEAARRVRPVSVQRAAGEVTRARPLVSEDADRAALEELATAMAEIERDEREGEALFASLYAAIDGGREAEAAERLEALRRSERRVERTLRTAWARIQTRIAATSRRAADDERRSVIETMALAVFGLLFGIAVSIWARRLLAPLTQLKERVVAVAEGDRNLPAPSVRRNDEIGRLEEEFERMVGAVAARDKELSDAILKELETKERLIQTERLAAMGRMAAHVTHEVRNPLSSIGLNVELLSEELAESGHPESTAIIASIQREVDRLTEITEEYLRLARLPSPQLEPEDLGALARDVATFVGRELERASVTLELDLEPSLPLVRADDAQVRQVLLNLLRNAREAMPNGGRIGLGARRDDGGVELRVDDAGEGVAPELRTRIFDAFYSTKERGTGLGLPLAQQIMVAHGGRIRCDASPLGGTTFALWFPTAATDDAA